MFSRLKNRFLALSNLSSTSVSTVSIRSLIEEGVEYAVGEGDGDDDDDDEKDVDFEDVESWELMDLPSFRPPTPVVTPPFIELDTRKVKRESE